MRVYNLTRIEVTDCYDLIKELIKLKKQKINMLSYQREQSHAKARAGYDQVIASIKEEISEYENYEIKVIPTQLKLDEKNGGTES
jgi:hypothetical protein